METNYTKIIKENLARFYSSLSKEIEASLPAVQKGDTLELSAFGGNCSIQPNGIFIDGKRQDDAIGILISLYAMHATSEPCRLEPFKAFKEFPNSMPYVGAFTTHTEAILLTHVNKVKKSRQAIMDRLGGQAAPLHISGDFSFVIYPLPKIALCYIFYDADEEFPPSVSCLFSNNALAFLPVAAMADTGEYTSKKIIGIVS